MEKGKKLVLCIILCIWVKNLLPHQHRKIKILMLTQIVVTTTDLQKSPSDAYSIKVYNAIIDVHLNILKTLNVPSIYGISSCSIKNILETLKNLPVFIHIRKYHQYHRVQGPTKNTMIERSYTQASIYNKYYYYIWKLLEASFLNTKNIVPYLHIDNVCVTPK